MKEGVKPSGRRGLQFYMHGMEGKDLLVRLLPALREATHFILPLTPFEIPLVSIYVARE